MFSQSQDTREPQISLPLPYLQGEASEALPRVLRGKDIITFVVLITLFMPAIPNIYRSGTIAFLYWIVGALVWMVPSNAVMRWLYLRIQRLGYVIWGVHVAGRRWGMLSLFSIWLAGIFATTVLLQSTILPLLHLFPNWFLAPIYQALCMVVVLALATVLCFLRLRLLFSLLGVLTIIYCALFLSLGLAGILWLLRGHASAVPLVWPPLSAVEFKFSELFGPVLWALVGGEALALMVREIKGTAESVRKETRMIWVGSAIVLCCYLAATFGTVVVVPLNTYTFPRSVMIPALNSVFGENIFGDVLIFLLFLCRVGTSVILLLSFSRLAYRMACIRIMPERFARKNRSGIPYNAIIAQAIVIFCAFLVLYTLLPSLQVLSVRPVLLLDMLFSVLQAIALIVWLVAMLQVFLFVIIALTGELRGESTAEGRTPKREALVLLGLAIVGCLTALTGIATSLTHSWVSPWVPMPHWFFLVTGITLLLGILGLLTADIPYVSAAVSELRRLHQREVELRARLQDAYNEQRVLVQQQQELIADVDRLYRENARAALTDPVTGLPNHRAVLNRLDRDIQESKQRHEQLGFLFVDIDHFKRINDRWGHLAGDAVLREVGQRLQQGVGENNFVGRYGGEEFAVIVWNVDVQQVAEIAERLRWAIASRPFQWNVEAEAAATEISLSASFGVAVCPVHGSEAKTLIQYADSAMYRAKNSGRNRVCIADEDERAIHMALSTSERFETVDERTTQALLAVTSVRDPYLYVHSRRVMILADAIAVEMKRPADEVRLLQLAALFHDIGKVGIPDSILHKPGPLTDEEWKMMRRHAELGSQILAQAGGIFVLVAGIVRAHHERWDGKGYPDGLVREEIPFPARILAVADAYDAMTFPRVCRKSVSSHEACQEIVRCAGSQFDPAVVRAFLFVMRTASPQVIQRLHSVTAGYGTLQNG
uniref:Diguanylate cyclase n=1 Tax=Thermosporothrix sp. COM3 TaxID=2490863 RepID=A0A455SNN2_9CHLR|nr:hypothetical protein KTC_35320 [Thermosporothrix sp. COM3]